MLLTIFLLPKRKRWLVVTLLASLVLCGSALTLLTRRHALLGHGEALRKGNESYFCEIDCHLAYSITDSL